MKKHTRIMLALIVFLCIGLVPLFSAFSFKLAPVTPLFREFMSDPFSNSTSFRLLEVKNVEGVPRGILAVVTDGDNEYVEIPFEEREFEGNNRFYQLKSAANIGLARLELGFFQIEGFINGGINSIFQNFGATDTLGFDGFYGAGGSVRLFDKIAFQAGFHHFSGHWGDEIITKMVDLSSYSLDDLHLIEYTRGNSWLASISIEPSEHFRLYGSVELPQTSAWIRPGAHVPFHTIVPGSTDDNQHEHITGQESVETTITYPDSYKAWRVQVGSEVRLPVYNLGSLFLATDFQFHQDGKTNHQVNGYDQSTPWECTFSAGGGFEFNRGLLDRKFRLEIYYHDGRFPLLNYFYKKSQYVVFGLAISG